MPAAIILIVPTDTHRQAAILTSIAKWASEHGDQPPKVSDWRRVTGTQWPSYLTVIRAFGSWDEAIRQAGFTPRGRGRKFRG